MKQRMKIRRTSCHMQMCLPSTSFNAATKLHWNFCYRTFLRATGFKLQLGEEAIVEITVDRISP